jgi:hypothetical protein
VHRPFGCSGRRTDPLQRSAPQRYRKLSQVNESTPPRPECARRELFGEPEHLPAGTPAGQVPHLSHNRPVHRRTRRPSGRSCHRVQHIQVIVERAGQAAREPIEPAAAVCGPVRGCGPMRTRVLAGGASSASQGSILKNAAARSRGLNLAERASDRALCWRAVCERRSATFKSERTAVGTAT